MCFQENICNLKCKNRILHPKLAERKAWPEIPIASAFAGIWIAHQTIAVLPGTPQFELK